MCVKYAIILMDDPGHIIIIVLKNGSFCPTMDIMLLA